MFSNFVTFFVILNTDTKNTENSKKTNLSFLNTEWKVSSILESGLVNNVILQGN